MYYFLFNIQSDIPHNDYKYSMNQGRRPRGTGGRPPPKFEVGDGPCIRPPNILRSSVVGCARKYEQSKERCFCCEERVIYDI